MTTRVGVWKYVAVGEGRFLTSSGARKYATLLEWENLLDPTRPEGGPETGLNFWTPC